ncbi:DUF2341 domain-containing protein [Candidatus Woesebacteria bacterium]|nr:MAG: DUF2341 domain-containing protein [Candidatus Woesebacteria bacterium]
MQKTALTAKQRLALMELVYKYNESVTVCCKKFGVSRFTFYKWAKFYSVGLSRNENLTNLRDKKPATVSTLNATPYEVQEQIKRIAAEKPDSSKYEIAKELRDRLGEKAVGVHGVYNVLKRSDLTTPEARKEWQLFVQAKSNIVLTAPQRLEVITRSEKLNIPVTVVCRDFGISRQTYYKWKRRWEEGGQDIDTLRDKKQQYDRRKFRIDREKEKAILSVIIETPDLSKYKIAEKLRELGYAVSPHGIYNVLLRNGLNLPEGRMNYAANHSQTIETPSIEWTNRIKSSLEQFLPTLAPAPPPVFNIIINFTKTFLASSVFALAVSYSSVWWLNFLLTQTTHVAIGLFFATLALLTGSIFFLYSLKYYITLAVVLSYSKDQNTIGIDSTTPLKQKGLISRIIGFNNNTSVDENIPVGLTSDLSGINISKKPFVSIHIPFYNEKYVVRRSIETAVNFDYQEYEIILCDDSTDDTSTIIRNYQIDHLPIGEKLEVVSGKGWEMATVEIRPGVFLKHLHRISRGGFKGGALKIALELVDPRCEFISVFDADFVPYPDTINLFLKYFKIQNGMSEDYAKSAVAAVQGYQWHVLNKSENWITRGVRSEYAGSYVIERSGQEIYGGLKHISGSVYMIRRDVLEKVGWNTSITEDYELTLRLYDAGYKVVYTPYIQAPAECVSTLKRLIRQRMRWAEGHSHNVKLMWKKLLFGSWEETGGLSNTPHQVLASQTTKLMRDGNAAYSSVATLSNSRSRIFVPSPLTIAEKIEFLFNMPYYLQAFLFLIGTFAWLLSEAVFQVRLPFWTTVWGWSLILTNMFSLPLVNAVGLFLEESEERDYLGLLSFVALSYILVPFQAYASIKGFLEDKEGGWFRTPKTGRITDVFTRGRFYRFIQGVLPRRGGQPAVAEAGVSQAYLALNSANNQFNSFSIKPKKVFWLGKASLAFVLIVVMLLNSLAFRVKPAEAWYGTEGWSYRIKLTVKNGKVDADLSNFPVYVNLDDLPDATFWAHVKSLCADVRVTNSGGSTELPIEIVSCDTTAKTGEMYFKADSLADSTDTDFYIYYGNSGASSYEVTDTYGRNNVWTNGYGGVWHMGGGTLIDSSGNVGNSTTQTGTEYTSGKVGIATDYSGSQRSIMPTATTIDEDVLDSLTYTVWVNSDSTSWGRQMEKSNQYFLLGNYAGTGSAGPLLKISGSNQVATVGTLSTGTWYQVGGRYSYSGGTTGVLNAILNGNINATTSNLSNYIDSANTGLYVGSDDSGGYFNGKMDELRIASVVRTTNWLSTEYNTLNDTSTFYSLEAEEEVPELVILLLPLAILIPFVVKYHEKRRRLVV